VLFLNSGCLGVDGPDQEESGSATSALALRCARDSSGGGCPPPPPLPCRDTDGDGVCEPPPCHDADNDGICDPVPPCGGDDAPGNCPPPPPPPCEGTTLPDGTSCWRCEGDPAWQCSNGWSCQQQDDGCWLCDTGDGGLKQICAAPACELVELPDGMICRACVGPDGTSSLDCPDGWQCRRVGDSPEGGACYSCYQGHTGEYKYMCHDPQPTCAQLDIPDPEIRCWECYDPATGQYSTTCNDGWMCESLDHTRGCWGCYNQQTGEQRMVCGDEPGPVCEPSEMPGGQDCQKCSDDGRTWYECADGTTCEQDTQGCWSCQNPRTGTGWGWCDGSSPGHPDRPVPQPA
jgi:hypothetical protein